MILGMGDTSHNGVVEQMTQEDLQGYLAARFQDHQASGRYASDQECIDRVNEESEMFDAEGAWLAYCSCGWRGNNPYPSRESAVSSLTKHYEQVGAAG